MKGEPRIYFIRPVAFPGPVKIGFSGVPQSRLEFFMTWAPFKLEVAVSIPGGRDLERNIHECLAEHHSHREWFHPTGKVLSVIDRLIAGVPIEEAIDLNDRRGKLAKKLAKKRAPIAAERRRYLSLRSRMRWALVKEGKKAGIRMFWDHGTRELLRFLEAWDGRSIEPEMLTARLEQILESSAQFMSPIPYWERKPSAPQTAPTHQEGAA